MFGLGKILNFQTWTPKIRGKYDTKRYDLKEEKKRANKNK